jgi:hypothetical protein
MGISLYTTLASRKIIEDYGNPSLPLPGSKQAGVVISGMPPRSQQGAVVSGVPSQGSGRVKEKEIPSARRKEKSEKGETSDEGEGEFMV